MPVFCNQCVSSVQESNFDSHVAKKHGGDGDVYCETCCRFIGVSSNKSALQLHFRGKEHVSIVTRLRTFKFCSTHNVEVAPTAVGTHRQCVLLDIISQHPLKNQEELLKCVRGHVAHGVDKITKHLQKNTVVRNVAGHTASKDDSKLANFFVLLGEQNDDCLHDEITVFQMCQSCAVNTHSITDGKFVTKARGGAECRYAKNTSGIELSVKHTEVYDWTAMVPDVQLWAKASPNIQAVRQKASDEDEGISAADFMRLLGAGYTHDDFVCRNERFYRKKTTGAEQTKQGKTTEYTTLKKGATSKPAKEQQNEDNKSSTAGAETKAETDSQPEEEHYADAQETDDKGDADSAF